MYRLLSLVGFCCAFSVVVLPDAPAFAINAKEKMVTCKFGADDEHLQGQQRTTFLKRCMSNVNDPRGPAPGATGAGGASKD